MIKKIINFFGNFFGFHLACWRDTLQYVKDGRIFYGSHSPDAGQRLRCDYCGNWKTFKKVPRRSLKILREGKVDKFLGVRLHLEE